jgi:hypothetical protein
MTFYAYLNQSLAHLQVQTGIWHMDSSRLFIPSFMWYASQRYEIMDPSGEQKVHREYVAADRRARSERVVLSGEQIYAVRFWSRRELA